MSKNDDIRGVGDNAINKTALEGYVKREEDINSRMQALRDERKDLRKDIKDAGYSSRIINEVVKLRANPENMREFYALFTTYAEAIGEQIELPLSHGADGDR